MTCIQSHLSNNDEPNNIYLLKFKGRATECKISIVTEWIEPENKQWECYSSKHKQKKATQLHEMQFSYSIIRARYSHHSIDLQLYCV